MSDEVSGQPIKGYRVLSAEEIALINEGKALANQVGAYIERVLDRQTEVTATFGTPDAEPRRWAAIGKTHLQQGFMALTRAIAKPEGF